MQATVLRTHQDVLEAQPGLYVVRSGNEAYWPAMALVEAGFAEFKGEIYDGRSRIVTLQVTTQPPADEISGPDDEYTHSIKIGREFLVAALKEYSDWPLKWWREAVQNSVDAGARHVQLSTEKLPDGNILVVCDDDGSGMDRDTILDKFLMLGGTTKIADGKTAGGFGVAKSLLILPWISWRIHSRDTMVEGAGIDYKPHSAPMRVGTRLEVIMPPDKTTDGAIAIGFLEKCYLPEVHFTVNDIRIHAALAGGHLVSQVPDGADVFFVPADNVQSYLYVRSHGLYMFSIYVGQIPGYIITELTAPSIEILTSNRDGFRNEVGSKGRQVYNALNTLAEKIAKDNMSALKNKQGLIRQKFEGSGRFRARCLAASLMEQVGPTHTGLLSVTDTEAVLQTIGKYVQQQEDDDRASQPLTRLPSADSAQAMLDQKFLGPNHIEAALRQLVWEPDFYVMNDIEGYKVPKKFFPATMTPTVLKLAKTWTELCRYVLMQLGSDVKFGVGFHFSSSIAASALTEEGQEGPEPWLMLNPHKDMWSPKEIWRPTVDADLKWLYAAAIHESTHVADNISYHDESFAAALTRNMAKCTDGYRKIKSIVAGIRMRGGRREDIPEELPPTPEVSARYESSAAGTYKA